MENSKFLSSGNDEFDVDSSCPYIAIRLTPEQVKEIENRKMECFTTDGKTFFQERNKEGKPIGMIFFLVFK